VSNPLLSLERVWLRDADHYRRALDVQNRGFGGYNTGFARELFDSIFAKKEQAANVPQVRLVTIWFGMLG
jgi:hypothetical protein